MSTNLNKNKLTFLIDTGADISLLKLDETDRNREFLDHTDCVIKGISDETTHSHGTIKTKFQFEDQTVNQRLHIVDYNFPIQTDGILGRDFLIKNSCKIDYETFTIALYFNDIEMILPMQTKLPHNNDIFIPARMQTIKAINLNLVEDSVILNEEIQEGIFVANTIVPSRGIAHVKILNTREESINIKNFTPKILPLRNFEILQAKTFRENKNDRYKKLLEELELDFVDKTMEKSLLDIFKEYSDVFHLNGDKLTANNFYEQKIAIDNSNPTYIKNYRLPHAQMDEIDRQIKKLENDDIIEPSNSPYNSPLLIVPKKVENGEKKWRLVVDFRQLNKKIIDDKFPITRLDDILDNLGRAKYFSTLDLTSSFHQIKLHKDSKSLTAFSTNKGHYQFKRLPFGLKISTNSFQRMLSIALSGLNTEAFLYVDDIIIFGCSLKHHNTNLIKTFDRLRRFNLKVNPQKCNFLKTEVTYLGHLITNKGIKTDPKKYDVIKKYPIPISADEIKRFVAFCNYYRRFIPKFAEIAKPLNTLTKKNTEFNWTENCQEAFDLLKQKLINPPILKYPNFDEVFVLTTDASNYALGAVLSQGEIGKDLPISYASRTLTKHEINKPIIEKELLSIHWAINFFRPYLYGRKFIVVTDHRPLVSLFSHKNPSSKLTRIRLDLSDYDFEIRYKQGKINTNADALSRIKIDSDTLKALIPTVDVNITTRAMKKKMENDKNNNNNSKNEEHEPKLDQLYSWNCTSITEIKNCNKLKFVDERKLDKNSMHYNNKTRKNKTKGAKLPSVIKVYKNKVDIHINDNPCKNHLGEILEKLIEDMKIYKWHKLAIEENDEIFSYISISEFKNIFNKLQNKRPSNLKIIIYKAPIKINNDVIKEKLIKEYHDTPYAGAHSGVKRTINKLKRKYVWKGMNKMVKNYVNKCTDCTKNKQIRHVKERLTITDTPQSSFETISMDTVGPLRICNDKRYILTVQCELTKYIEAIPMENKEAKTIAKALIENIILKYGNFKKIKTDLGTEFINETMKKICQTLNIEHITSTAYHHETLGSIERNHRVLNEYLLSFTKDNIWDEWIPYFVFSYNITPHTDTGYSPYELIFGKVANLPNEEILQSDNKIYNIDDYAKEVKFRLIEANKKAQELITNAKIKRKQVYDKNINPINIDIGDLVYLKNENRKKLDNPYKGPYEVIELNGVNTKIKIGSNVKKVHNNRLKKYNTNN